VHDGAWDGGTHTEELSELRVTGQAWRVGSTAENVVACPACERLTFRAGALDVDPTAWDGSDFFNVDLNPNIVLVSGRVCELFRARSFSNYACVPVP
jgi:hypothetical protein